MRPDELGYAAHRDGRLPRSGAGPAPEPKRTRLQSYALLGVLTAAVAAGVGFGVSSTRPQEYRASAEVLLRPPGGLSSPLTDNSGDPERDIQTQVQLLLSPPVANLVQRRLGAAPAVAVVPVGRTNILEVTATAADPSRAAVVANAYVDAFLQYRADASQQTLFTAEGAVRGQAAALAQEIGAVENQLATSTGRSRSALLAARAQLAAQQPAFAQRSADLRLQAALQGAGPVILAEATPPRSSTRPDPLRTGAVAAVLGLMLGIGLAYLLADRARRRAAAATVEPG
jgi:uncharacterized protein involved in exopolysaccharide biosynthesis